MQGMELQMNRIETERLILRNFEERDLNDLYEYLSDPEVVKYEPYKAMTLNEVRENLSWRKTTEEMIAVEDKHTGKMIGNVYFGNRDFNSREIGYVFNRSFWGCGYAGESCHAVIAQAFSNGVHRIYAECDPINQASWKLLERMGFIREAHFKENVYFWKNENGEPIWKDTYVYALLNKN